MVLCAVVPEKPLFFKNRVWFGVTPPRFGKHQTFYLIFFKSSLMATVKSKSVVYFQIKGNPFSTEIGKVGDSPFYWANILIFQSKHFKANLFLFMTKPSQELRMLSSFTINCQVTKIVMNSGSQLSEV